MLGQETHVAVVRGGRQVLVLLAGEDVDGHKVTLCVTVLAGLRGGDVSNLATHNKIAPSVLGASA